MNHTYCHTCYIILSTSIYNYNYNYIHVRHTSTSYVYVIHVYLLRHPVLMTCQDVYNDVIIQFHASLITIILFDGCIICIVLFDGCIIIMLDWHQRSNIWAL